MTKDMSLDLDEQISISIPSIFGYEEVITEAVGSIAKIKNFPLEKTSKLKLAVAEACINAIEHGNNKDASKKVMVTITSQENLISASIHDQGRNQIEPDHKMTDLGKQIQNKQIGGWGLFLIEKLVDSVEVESDPGRFTKTTLTVNRNDDNSDGTSQ